MSANFRVATPVQISVAHDTPAEKESSGSHERFSNLLSQRHAAREEAAPSPHVLASKPKDSVKPKESKPDDALQLLHRSAAIQPSVTPTLPHDAPTQVQAQPVALQQTQPQPVSLDVDDIVSKAPAKTAAPLVIALPVTPLEPAPVETTPQVAAAPATQASPLLQNDPAAAMTMQTTQADAAAPVAKPPVAIPTAPQSASDQTLPATKPSTKATAPLPTFKPTTLAAVAPSPMPPVTDAKTSDVSATPAPLPEMPSPTAEKPAVTADAAKPADTMSLPQQPAIASSQPEISNAAPTILASAIVAATHHTESHTDSSDDSIDGIDSATSTGAIPTFSLHEARDIATADGKTPVPAPSSPEFGDALGAKLSWMAERHIGHAEIRLSPDNLGAVDVRVHLNGDRVRAEFNAANPEVRQAINDHIPRLRDMLSSYGFDLAESHVGNGSNPQHSPSARPEHGSMMGDDDVALPAPHIPAYTHNGILDAFA